jgi:phosphoribosylglycinamide formyltransferase 1
MTVAAPPQLAILISGRGSNMGALLGACLSGQVAARPVAVISDRADAPGLELARTLGVPAAALPGAADRAQLEESLHEALAASRADIIALAGFMRILSPQFVTRYLGRMLNIHPSLLPAHRGLHTHRRVLAAGEREHGASVHFVTPELDSGPVVLQSRIAVRADDSESTLAARVLATEHVIYPRALGWFAQQRLTWHDGAPWLDGERLDVPIVEDFRAAELC